MKTFEVVLAGIAPVVAMLGIALAALYARGHRIQELTGEVHSLRAQRDNLSEQISQMKEDQSESVNRLTKQHDEIVKGQNQEIDRLHKELKLYEERDTSGGMCSDV